MDDACSHIPRMLTIREVAEHLRLSTKTVRRIIKAGRLPVYRIGESGRLIRVSEDDLKALLAVPATRALLATKDHEGPSINGDSDSTDKL